MKKILVSLRAIALLSVQSSSTQSKLTDNQKTELKARFQEYKSKLNLTQEQKVRIIDSTYILGLSDLKVIVRQTRQT